MHARHFPHLTLKWSIKTIMNDVERVIGWMFILRLSMIEGGGSR